MGLVCRKRSTAALRLPGPRRPAPRRHQPLTLEDYRLVPGADVFTLSGRAPRLSVDAQQQRALHLMSLLFAAGALKGKRVVVVGAGVAGLTFAVAAALAEVGSLHIVDRAPAIMGNLKQAHHRAIHPAMLDWPRRGWDRMIAWSPLLRWHTMRGDRLWARLVDAWHEWQQLLGPEQLPDPTLHRDVRLWRDGAAWQAQLVGPEGTPEAEPVEVDLVIVATGPGHERHVDRGRPQLRYWDHDGVALDGHAGRERVLVVGGGDGALIDCVRHAVLSDRGHGLVEHADILRLMFTSGAASERSFRVRPGVVEEVARWVQGAALSPYQVTLMTGGPFRRSPANGFHRLVGRELIRADLITLREEQADLQRESETPSWSRIIVRVGPDIAREVQKLFPREELGGPFPLPRPSPIELWRAKRLIHRLVQDSESLRIRVEPEELRWDPSEWQLRVGDLWLQLVNDPRLRRYSRWASQEDVVNVARSWRSLIEVTATLGDCGRASTADMAWALDALSAALRWLVPLGAWATARPREANADARQFGMWLRTATGSFGGRPRWLAASNQGVLVPPSPGCEAAVHLWWLRREQLRWTFVVGDATQDCRVGPALQAGDRWQICDHVQVASEVIRSVREICPPRGATAEQQQQLILTLGGSAGTLWLPGGQGLLGALTTPTLGLEQTWDHLAHDARLRRFVEVQRDAARIP